MTRRVLGITYINENKALYCAAIDYCWLLRQAGYEADVHDASTAGGIEALYAKVQSEKFDFCYGLQGVGSRLTLGGVNLWQALQIPFVGIHHDNPCYNVFNHCSDSPYVGNLYCFPSHIDLHKRYIGTNQFVDLSPYEAVAAPYMPRPFKDRSIKILYIKSGESMDECTTAFQDLPPALQKSLFEKTVQAERDPNLVICDLIQSIFDAFHTERASEFNLFWGLAHWMDKYLRRKRAIDFVNWLKKQDGAVIVGNGWDFIDKTQSRATFLPAVPGPEIQKLYDDAQIICNTNPYGSDVIHERPVTGLLSKCVVISDRNAWWSAHAHDFPALTLFDWTRPLDEQLEPVLKQIPTEEALDAGRNAACRHFIPNNRTQKLIDMADAVRAFAQKSGLSS